MEGSVLADAGNGTSGHARTAADIDGVVLFGFTGGITEELIAWKASLVLLAEMRRFCLRLLRRRGRDSYLMRRLYEIWGHRNDGFGRSPIAILPPANVGADAYFGVLQNAKLHPVAALPVLP